MGIKKFGKENNRKNERKIIKKKCREWHRNKEW